MTKLIVGLGNPGIEYEYTYHNMGFLAIEILARRLRVKLSTRECNSIVGVKSTGGDKIVLAQPQTFMNNSGQAVKQLVGKYGGDLIVVYDDIDIEKGKFRYRERGSAGTHNGMRSIISELKTDEFARLRIGTGPLPEGIPLVAYVLAEMRDDERPLVAESIKAGIDKLFELFNAEKDNA